MDFGRDDYLKLGQNISQRQENQLSTQLAVFRSALVNFASDHGDEITNNKEFRTKFTQMCQLVGVDPLDLQILISSSMASSENKSKEKEDLSVAISVRVVEECTKTRDINGGLISLKELVSRLNEADEKQNNGSGKIPKSAGSRFGVNMITEESIVSSLSVLGSLGKGYELLTINHKKWLKFTNNVSSDHKRVYELCEFTGGYVTTRLLRDNFQWDQVRCKAVIDEMIMKGFLWLDLGKKELQYWEPSWS